MITASGTLTNEFFDWDSVKDAMVPTCQIVRIEAPDKQKIVFSKGPLAGTVIFVKKPLQGKDPIATAGDKYNLAVALRMDSSSNTDYFVFLGKRIVHAGTVIGFQDNRNDLIIQLVQEAASMGHVLAKEWLETLIPSNTKASTASTFVSLGVTADSKQVSCSPQAIPNSPTTPKSAVSIGSAASPKSSEFPGLPTLFSRLAIHDFKEGDVQPPPLASAPTPSRRLDAGNSTES